MEAHDRIPLLLRAPSSLLAPLTVRHSSRLLPLPLRPLRGIRLVVIPLRCRDYMFTMPILLQHVHEWPYDIQGEGENDGGVFFDSDIGERLQVTQLQRTGL